MDGLNGKVEQSRRGKVMVVDDDSVALRITRARLEGAGFEVITRDNPFGTTLAVMKELPDIVILDLNMPGLPGSTLAMLMRKHPDIRGLQVVFHSSQPLVTLQAMAEKTGALGAIPKTDDDALFVTQFERLLERAQLGANS